MVFWFLLSLRSLMKKASVRTKMEAFSFHILFHAIYFYYYVYIHYSLKIWLFFFFFPTAFVRPDKENGEISVQGAHSNVVPPSLPPKPGTLSYNTETHIHETQSLCLMYVCYISRYLEIYPVLHGLLFAFFPSHSNINGVWLILCFILVFYITNVLSVL